VLQTRLRLFGLRLCGAYPLAYPLALAGGHGDTRQINDSIIRLFGQQSRQLWADPLAARRPASVGAGPFGPAGAALARRRAQRLLPPRPDLGRRIVRATTGERHGL
jgi:hypothetical protein